MAAHNREAKTREYAHVCSRARDHNGSRVYRGFSRGSRGRVVRPRVDLPISAVFRVINGRFRLRLVDKNRQSC